jgi:hypothetical protein
MSEYDKIQILDNWRSGVPGLLYTECDTPDEFDSAVQPLLKQFPELAIQALRLSKSWREHRVRSPVTISLPPMNADMKAVIATEPLFRYPETVVGLDGFPYVRRRPRRQRKPRNSSKHLQGRVLSCHFRHLPADLKAVLSQYFLNIQRYTLVYEHKGALRTPFFQDTK